MERHKYAGFGEIYRTVLTRDIIFTDQEMDMYGIEKICNIISDYRFISEQEISMLIRNHSRDKRCAVAEIKSEGKKVVVSILVFKSLEYFNIFVVRKWKDWGSGSFAKATGYLLN
jgi:hypothetical protein